MEILPKLNAKDSLHYGIAVGLSVLGGFVAFQAVQRTYATLFIFAALAQYTTAQQRVLHQFALIVLSLAWAVYMLTILPLYNGAITKARVRRAQGRTNAATVPAWMQWLVNEDIDILGRRFVYTFAIPVAVLILVTVIGLIAVG